MNLAKRVALEKEGRVDIFQTAFLSIFGEQEGSNPLRWSSLPFAHSALAFFPSSLLLLHARLRSRKLKEREPLRRDDSCLRRRRESHRLFNSLPALSSKSDLTATLCRLPLLQIGKTSTRAKR